jgi:uncharacterized radical SAM superfamily Fe-S cluster-containing enzyme
MLLVSVVISGALLMSGCSNKTPMEEKAQNLKDEQIRVANSLPSWVLNPESRDGITAVGMAGYSRHGLKVMKPQAEMDARAKLAAQIQTYVSRSQKKVIRSTNVADIDDFENIFSQTTKEIVKEIPLSGAVIVKQKMMENGDFYVQMVIKKHEVLKELDANREVYKKKLQKADLTQKNLDKAMNILDTMMDDLDEELEE